MYKPILIQALFCVLRFEIRKPKQSLFQSSIFKPKNLSTPKDRSFQNENSLVIFSTPHSSFQYKNGQPERTANVNVALKSLRANKNRLEIVDGKSYRYRVVQQPQRAVSKQYGVVAINPYNPPRSAFSQQPQTIRTLRPKLVALTPIETKKPSTPSKTRKFGIVSGSLGAFSKKSSPSKKVINILLRIECLLIKSSIRPSIKMMNGCAINLKYFNRFQGYHCCLSSNNNSPCEFVYFLKILSELINFEKSIVWRKLDYFQP